MSDITIYDRLMESIPDDYDKSQGSFFYDIFKPVSLELNTLDEKNSDILNAAFVFSATGADLEKRVLEVGLTRKSYTYSDGYVLVTGTIGAKILKGSLCASELLKFEFLEDFEIDNETEVLVRCLDFGSVGNVPANAIKFFPVSILGAETVTNNLPFTNGYDAESDEDLRERYFLKVSEPATSGNIYHYRNWANSIVGVGDSKVFPLWNGNGTVKVVIADANMQSASLELITEVSEYIENERPIGASVTVVSAEERVINISANVSTNVDISVITDEFKAKVLEYFREIAFKNTYLSYAKIGSILFDVTGVLDYTNLLVNLGTSNIQIGEIEVLNIGTVVLNVI